MTRDKFLKIIELDVIKDHKGFYNFTSSSWTPYLGKASIILVSIFRDALFCQTLDLEEFGRLEKVLESFRLNINLSAVDVSDEALDINECRISEDDNRMIAWVLLQYIGKSR